MRIKHIKGQFSKCEKCGIGFDNSKDSDKHGEMHRAKHEYPWLTPPFMFLRSKLGKTTW